MKTACLALVCLLAATSLSCEQEEPAYFNELRREHILDQFGYYSRSGDLVSAEALLTDLEDLPDGPQQAAYGRAVIAIAQSIQAASEMFAIVDLVASQGAPAFEQLAESGSTVTRIIHNPIRKIREAVDRLHETAQTIIAEHPEGSIELRQFMFSIGTAPVLSVDAEVDRTDLALFSAFASLIGVISDVLLATEFGIEISSIGEILGWLNDNPKCQPIATGNKECLLELASELLNRYDRPPYVMLGLIEPDGATDLKRVSADLVEFVDWALLARDSGFAETDDQVDDFLIVSPPGHPRFDQNVPENRFEFIMQNVLWPGSGKHYALGYIEDRIVTPMESDAVNYNASMDATLFEGLELLRSHYSGETGPISVLEGFLPFVQILSPIVLNSSIGAAALGGAEEQRGINDQLNLLGLDLQQAFQETLKELLPAELAYYDFHRAFQNAMSLRALLPHYDFHVNGGPSTIAIDFECPYDETIDLICETPVKDRAHFQSTEDYTYTYGMDADGIAERGPYIAFQEPIFGGFLSLNLAAAPQTEVERSFPGEQGTLVEADNPMINYVIHRVIEKTDALISGLADGLRK